MIKSDENTSLTTTRAGVKSAACWHREPNIPAVRFEILDGDIFVFPYQHLTFASLKPSDGEDRLTVTFVSHEVTIQGRQLLSLLKALQGFSLEWVCVLPSHHVEMLQDASVSVRKIAIRALNQAV